VVVSYQKGLARGIYTEAEYCSMMRWMQEVFRREGIVFDGIYSCPSGSRQPVVQPIGSKNWKPGAGMLHRAAQNLHLSLTDSVMVGARGIDVAVANAGGLSRAFLLRKSGEETCGGASTAVDSLGEVETWLVSHGKGANLPPASQDLAVA
jgi:D-glycero-D-manno-heptose 1,7-bisphosphate phosphatase